MTTIRARFADLPGNTRGFVWAFMAAVVFMTMVLIVRRLSAHFNAGELAFWRAFFGLLLLTPVFMRSGSALFRTHKLGTHVMRNLFHFVGIAAWFYAVGRINLSVGMALQFTIPLFTMVLAIAILRERVDSGRWLATGIGFVGVIVILQPGEAPIQPAAVACIVSAMGYAASNITTKVLKRSASSDTVVFYMNLVHLPLALATAWAMGGMTIPRLQDMPWLLALGGCATLAHWLLAQALGEADASLVTLIDFTKLPLIALGAFIAFGEKPVLWAWVGGAVIFSSTYYIVRREARAARMKA